MANSLKAEIASFLTTNLYHYYNTLAFNKLFITYINARTCSHTFVSRLSLRDLGSIWTFFNIQFNLDSELVGTNEFIFRTRRLASLHNISDLII